MLTRLILFLAELILSVQQNVILILKWISYACYNERPLVKSVKADSTDN